MKSDFVLSFGGHKIKERERIGVVLFWYKIRADKKRVDVLTTILANKLRYSRLG